MKSLKIHNIKRSIQGGKRFKLVHDEQEISRPQFSIITVVYNGEKYLQNTIDSIKNQKGVSIEYIVIDGGSTDCSLDIIKKNELAIDYWISEPDKGIYDAMNKGIKQSNGEIIGLLNSDDFFQNDALLKVYNIYKENAKLKDFIICGGINRVDESGKYLYTIIKNTSEQFFKKSLKYFMPVNHPATFVTKGIYEKYGLFNFKLKYSADYEIVLRWYVNNVNFVFTKNVLTNMRVGGVSFSSSNLFKRANENHIARKINNISDSHYISTKWFVLTLLKDFISKFFIEINFQKILYKKYEKQ